MKIKKQSDDDVLEGDLTPMIDMTFQLIAFFMVLINFTQTETDDRVKLPDSSLAKPPEIVMEDPIIIQLTDQSEVIFGRSTLAVNQLQTSLSREYQGIQFSGRDPKDTTVVIRAHGDAAAGEVQEVIQVCQDVGFENFALRAQENIQTFKYIAPTSGP